MPWPDIWRVLAIFDNAVNCDTGRWKSPPAYAPLLRESLERQVTRQAEQREQVRSPIDQGTVIQRQIVPLIDRRIARLEQFVAGYAETEKALLSAAVRTS
jgi:hypothetical protein